MIHEHMDPDQSLWRERWHNDGWFTCEELHVALRQQTDVPLYPLDAVDQQEALAVLERLLHLLASDGILVRHLQNGEED